MYRKKLPIGIDHFEKIRTNDFYYVDKTMFIRELLQNWGEVNLFTRPRRFGKTLNMSMLKAFFEIGGDPSLFDGLKIAEERSLCEQYMCQFPVIFISLKSVEGPSFEDAAAALQTVIGDEAARFRFLLESSRLAEEEKDAYRRMIRVDPQGETSYVLPYAALRDSLKTLSRLLSKHYDRKVILLIDEYDVPLDKAFQAGYYDEMTALIRNLFGNALKTNDALYFAVLTGCLRISKESIFTGLNNIKVHTISDARYDEYFGFIDTEVKDMLDDYGLLSSEDTIRDWYDGYLFGNVHVYCPWDVLNYCDALLEDPEVEPENYWANTSGNDLIRRLLKKADASTRDEIERLINGNSIVKKIHPELTYREIETTVENIWSVLYAAGYLTQAGRLPGKRSILILPNREVKELFAELAQDWFRETIMADTSKIQRFCDAFLSGDAALIEEMLNNYLWDSISVRDTAVRMHMKENFYHGMLLGLLGSQGSWKIQSNAELGEGYSDISIRTQERTGIVIELKYAHDGNLETACQEAITQIRERRYEAGLKRQGMKTTISYGIAFYEKDCKVVTF